MSLKDLCVNNMVGIIKNMPPMIKEEIIGTSLKEIKNEVRIEERLEIMNEIRKSASIIVEDITDKLIIAHQTSTNWIRPEYTKDIDDELYYMFVNISERFVDKYFEKLVFNERNVNRRDSVYYNSDSDGNDSD